MPARSALRPHASAQPGVSRAAPTPAPAAERRNVPMFRTRVPNRAFGGFAGELVVSMRPYAPERVAGRQRRFLPSSSWYSYILPAGFRSVSLRIIFATGAWIRSGMPSVVSTTTTIETDALLEKIAVDTIEANEVKAVVAVEKEACDKQAAEAGANAAGEYERRLASLQEQLAAAQAAEANGRALEELQRWPGRTPRV